MGMWDSVCSATQMIVGGATGTTRAAAPYLGGGWKNTCQVARVSSELVVSLGQAVVERMRDRDRLEAIGRVGLRIADHAINLGTKPYTSGIPVYKYVKEEVLLSKNNSQEQPKKDKKENMELSKLVARIESLEKENMELQELKLKMENIIQTKLVESKQNVLYQKIKRRPKLMYWSPPESVDLIYTAESTENLELSLLI